MSVIYGNPITFGVGEIIISAVLDENSWDMIKRVSSLGNGANFWSIGDCKQITMNGKVSDGLTLTNYSAWVYIIGFNHNAEREGNGIAFQGFKATKNGTPVCLVDSGFGDFREGTWFIMNSTDTTTGGWQASLMRKNIIPLIKEAFPADLRAVIKPSTIYTDNTGGGTADVVPTATQDEVFLLAEYEVFGTNKKASSQEPNYLKQYSYYSAGNSKIMYKHNDTSSLGAWWERSPSSSSYSFFCFVVGNGSANANNSTKSLGVAPCFKV